jgi:glutamyl-tRNA reductase
VTQVETLSLRAPTVGLDALRLLSASSRTVSLAELERLALSRAQASSLCRRLLEHGLRAVVLSTCNRTEVYWCSESPADEALVEAETLACAHRGSGGAGGAAPQQRLREDCIVSLHGEQVVTHLFRVASGLESQLVGEAEVLGQVREAFEIATAAESTDELLSELFRAALRAGRHARAHTGIGIGALSVSSAAVSLLHRSHPEIARGQVLVIGAGEVGRAAARHLTAAGIGQLVLMNRTVERAQSVAAEIAAHVAQIEELPRRLSEADAVLVATQVDEPLLTVKQVADAMSARRGRALVLFDLSLPRGIDPAVSDVNGVHLHDLSALEELVDENRLQREREIPRVEVILDQERYRFRIWVRRYLTRPLVGELRRRAEQICRTELASLFEGTGDPEALERATQRVVRRLLFAPIRALERGDLPLEGQHASYLRRLFGLEPNASEGD